MAQIDNASFSVNSGLKSRLQDLARHILDERDRRQWYLPRAFFDEAPWQLLLVLYVSDTRRLSSEALANSVLQPSATSRWIDYLETEGLITRRVEPSDNSRSMVELTPLALGLLDLYLTDRLQRAEQRSKPAERRSRAVRSQLTVGLVVLVTAILSAGITYLLTAH